MKRILFTMLLCVGIAYGQTGGMMTAETKPVTMTSTIPGITSLGTIAWCDCGEWKTKIDTSEWVAVDTLNISLRDAKRKSNSLLVADLLKRDWIYDKVRSITPFVQGVTAEWNPCKGSFTKEEQYRICSITGIRQRREITHRGWYEKSLTEYEKTVKKFTENKPQ